MILYKILGRDCVRRANDTRRSRSCGATPGADVRLAIESAIRARQQFFHPVVVVAGAVTGAGMSKVYALPDRLLSELDSS